MLRTWNWRFDSPVEAIWSVLADTARFNEAAEIPKHEIEEIAQPDGSVRYVGRGRFGLLTYRWDEKPVNWVHQRWFEHCRYFHGSPFESICARLELVAESAGCRGAYTMDIVPRNALGRLMLSSGLLSRIERTFNALADDARQYCRGQRDTEFDCKPPELTAGAARRARELVARIEESAHGHGLAQRLADYLLGSQEVDVWSIRPLKLARRWQVPERHAIELCLEAVRQGLLRLRWDLLCPRCQIGKSTVPAMDQLPTGAHCPTCNIDYGRDYSNNVELAFHPATAIRSLEGGEYCLFGPMSTAHVKLQVTLEPGQKRGEPVELAHGPMCQY